MFFFQHPVGPLAPGKSGGYSHLRERESPPPCSPPFDSQSQTLPKSRDIDPVTEEEEGRGGGGGSVDYAGGDR